MNTLATPCMICERRTANVTLLVLRNGTRETIKVCRIDYQKLVDQHHFYKRLDRVLGDPDERSIAFTS